MKTKKMIITTLAIFFIVLTLTITIDSVNAISTQPCMQHTSTCRKLGSVCTTSSDCSGAKNYCDCTDEDIFGNCLERHCVDLSEGTCYCSLPWQSCSNDNKCERSDTNDCSNPNLICEIGDTNKYTNDCVDCDTYNGDWDCPMCFVSPLWNKTTGGWPGWNTGNCVPGHEENQDCYQPESGEGPFCGVNPLHSDACDPTPDCKMWEVPTWKPSYVTGCLGCDMCGRADNCICFSSCCTQYCEDQHGDGGVCWPGLIPSGSGGDPGIIFDTEIGETSKSLPCQCYFYKRDIGEYCANSSWCNSGLCDQSDHTCIGITGIPSSLIGQVTGVNEEGFLECGEGILCPPCDADGPAPNPDGFACGLWKTDGDDSVCYGDELEQVYSSGSYISPWLPLISLPRTVTWTAVSWTELNTEGTNRDILFKYKATPSAEWSMGVSTSPITIPTNPAVTGRQIKFNVKLNTSDLTKTPNLTSISFNSTPRLTNTSQVSGSLEGKCWPISKEFVCTLDPSHIASSGCSPGQTYNAITFGNYYGAKVMIDTTKYTEINYSDNQLYKQNGDYCWK